MSRVAEALFAKEISARFDKLFGPTEVRLGLPPGMLSSIIRDHDYLAVIKMIATIEPVLNAAIETEFTKPHGGLGGQSNEERFSRVAARLLDGQLRSRLDIALAIRAIDQDDFNFVTSLSMVRNRYAHNIKSHSKSIFDLCEEIRPSSGKIYRHLLYSPKTDNNSAEFSDALKFEIVTSFSYFLMRMEKSYHLATQGLMSSVFGLSPRPDGAPGDG